MLAIPVLLMCAITANDITQSGAVGDGVTLNTQAIQAAIDNTAESGGGEVLFPPGTFLTGTIYLKNNIHLRLSQGTVILGSDNLADYPLTRCNYPSRSDCYTLRALIWGEGLENITISGPGVIDGQGARFAGKTASPEEVAAAAEPYAQQGRYIPDKVYLNRPYLIRLISCRNVSVQDLTLRNSAMWMQHYLDCDFLTLHGLNVFNHVAANNDMIDIDGCRNVIVSDCIGDTDDDALTLKSTGARPTEHVVITNCLLSSHCNAIKAGTESCGGFKDITISNCVIRRSAVQEAKSGRSEGLAGIALEIVDGGTLERVAISNIVIEGTTAPLFMRLGNRARAPKPSDPKPAPGVFRDVSISGVIATTDNPMGCAFSGIPGYPIENISLSNIHLTFPGGGALPQAEVPEVEEKYPECTMFGPLPAYGFYFRHAKNVRLRDIELTAKTPDPRPPIMTVDAELVRDAQ